MHIKLHESAACQWIEMKCIPACLPGTAHGADPELSPEEGWTFQLGVRAKQPLGEHPRKQASLFGAQLRTKVVEQRLLRGPVGR